MTKQYLLKPFLIIILISHLQMAYSDTSITTTNPDNTSTIINMPDVGPDTITTVITPSTLSSTTQTIVNEDGSTSSKTVTATITPGVDTPSTTIINQDD